MNSIYYGASSHKYSLKISWTQNYPKFAVTYFKYSVCVLACLSMLYYLNVFLLTFWLKFKSHLHFAFLPSFATMVAKAMRAAKKAAAPKAAAPKKAMKAMKAKKK